MKWRTGILILAAFGAGVCVLFNIATREPVGPAHQVFVGGTVLTMDSEETVAEAVSIRFGQIDSVGTTEAILNDTTSHTDIVDLRGRTVMPGLIVVEGSFPLAGLRLLRRKDESNALYASTTPPFDTDTMGTTALIHVTTTAAESYLREGVTALAGDGILTSLAPMLARFRWLNLFPQRLLSPSPAVDSDPNTSNLQEPLDHATTRSLDRLFAVSDSTVSRNPDRAALLRALTIDAAERFGVAKAIGSIEIGKTADLVVLSANPLAAVDPGSLIVERTLINGATIFSRR